jgi:hypothetical protein
MPPSVKNRDITGTKLSANAAVSEEKWDNTGTTLSANAAMRNFISVT